MSVFVNPDDVEWLDDEQGDLPELDEGDKDLKKILKEEIGEDLLD